MFECRKAEDHREELGVTEHRHSEQGPRRMHGLVRGGLEGRTCRGDGRRTRAGRGGQDAAGGGIRVAATRRVRGAAVRGGDEPGGPRGHLAALLGLLVHDLEEQVAREEAVQARRGARWLRDNSGWFLILDNVDSREAAEAGEGLLAHLAGGHVVVTSRLVALAELFEPLRPRRAGGGGDGGVPAGGTDGSRREGAEATRRTPATLATELDGLALALEQAGAFIAERRLSIRGLSGAVGGEPRQGAGLVRRRR